MGPEKTVRALSTIERNAKLQAQLIDDLLNIARILRGKLKLELAPVNLGFVLQAAFETVHTAAREKDIAIQVEANLPLQVRGDTGRLQQIVWNLLTNAVKFTPRGGSVLVSLEQVTGPENNRGSGAGAQVSGKEQIPIPNTQYAQITVTDTGMGIHADLTPTSAQTMCRKLWPMDFRPTWLNRLNGKSSPRRWPGYLP